ncbi:Short-chain dehydrogenase [Apiospora kogelbergensis]|uniref:Short-chain dehydrogenase n=1 Tax=Apiospora kogelbergensis TaxID=1337665 RepID=UPI003131D5A0
MSNDEKTSVVDLQLRVHGFSNLKIADTRPPPSPSGGQITHEQISLDLSRLSNVREVAAAVNARVQSGTIPPIRALILNADFEEFDTQTWNEDGLDMSFVVNYLGHWLLTLLLLTSMDREDGRIVWISSWYQKQVIIPREGDVEPHIEREQELDGCLSPLW